MKAWCYRMLHVYTVLFPAFLRSQHCQHLSSGIHETTSPQNWKLKLVMFQIQRLLHGRCWMITIYYDHLLAANCAIGCHRYNKLSHARCRWDGSPSLDLSPASRCPFSSFCWCHKKNWAKGGQKGPTSFIGLYGWLVLKEILRTGMSSRDSRG